jgi:hypothetical protein
MKKPACPNAEVVASASAACGEAIQQAFNSAKRIAESFGVDDNPLGVVCIVYCRECDCTHATHYEPDGPLGAAVFRAANACRVAATRVRIELGEREHEQQESSKKSGDAN